MSGMKRSPTNLFEEEDDVDNILDDLEDKKGIESSKRPSTTTG